SVPVGRDGLTYTPAGQGSALLGVVRGYGGPPAGVAGPTFEVVMSGLDNPRGLAFGPEGALYVAEAGRGGDGPCFEVRPGQVVCYGPSGAVSRLRRGHQGRIATGLPSLVNTDGGPTGADAIYLPG